jgi:hypothetical protein
MKKFKKEDKLMSFDTENKVYCKNLKCKRHGVGVVFYKKETDRILCPNCNEWIYKDPQTKLKYEMKERGVKID